ncbi:hypothetical protein [Henriciella sp.]|uniref:hypothetical protein n=1 Tax=Henriciella sp. TaxID=1968823 RepID=UPI000C10FECC|nr:hypothetical protein [Henriciella sp.]PHR83109.1 MAG: hypothetical protein COA64_00190 [Henriciella sp.]
MNKHVRVNVRSLANTKAAQRVKRNGRDLLIIPSATLPDNVVMNGIKYPADEIERSYKTLNRTPAPFGHPMVDGVFVSAREPEGINASWVGAWNENVRRENGRVFLDKVIDIEFAKQLEGGRTVLNAVDKGEPIHTSTGLLCELENCDGSEDHKFIARNIMFDHDAILIGEDGAATPEQGVGMFVNSKGEQEQVEVINSAFERADTELDWAVDSMVRALEQREKAPLKERIKSAILEMFTSSEREPSANRKEADMTVSKEQFDALSAKVDTLSEAIKPETLANAVKEAVKPLTDNLEALQNAQKAKDEAELKGYVETIVKANLLTEDEANELTLNAARSLAEKAKPGKAAPLNPAFAANNGKPTFQLPKAEA